MKKISFLLLLALFLSPIAAFADNIGFIDMEKIFSKANMIKKYESENEKRRTEYQKFVKEREDKIEEAKKANKSEDDIKKLISKFEEEIRPKQEELSKIENDFRQKFFTTMTNTSQQVAKSLGIDVVVDKRAILTGGTDITEFVINRLNDDNSPLPTKSSSSKRKK